MVVCAIMTIFLFSIYFLKEERRQQLRKSESHVIKKSSLSLVVLFLSTSVCEGCPVYVAGVGPVGGGVWENDVCLA